MRLVTLCLFVLTFVFQPVSAQIYGTVENPNTINISNNDVDWTDSDGICSLIEAIVNANDDAQTYVDCPTGNAVDLLLLPSGDYNLTQSFLVDDETAFPDITSHIMLEGLDTGAYFNGIDDLRAFKVTGNGHLSIHKLNFIRGAVTSHGSAIMLADSATLDGSYNYFSRIRYTPILADGTDIHIDLAYTTFEYNESTQFDSGIKATNATITLRYVQFKDNFFNTSYGTPSYLSGSVININGGSLTIENSLFDHNRGAGGGIFIGGATEVNINHTIFHGNGSFYGGAIKNHSSQSVTIRNSWFRYNAANYHAGAIYHAGGTMLIENSTIRDSSAGTTTGGIYVSSISELTLRNVTFSDQYLTDYSMYPPRDGAMMTINGIATIESSTLHGGGNYTQIIVGAGGRLTFRNSVINSYGASICDITEGGSVQSAGYNIISDTSCGLVEQGDVQGISPQVQTIIDYNQYWNIHPLGETSPAINHIPASHCNLEQDIIGTLRPQYGACDSGAFEASWLGIIESDMNGDGLITPIDAMFVLNRIGQSATETPIADVNEDNLIDQADVQIILDRLGN